MSEIVYAAVFVFIIFPIIALAIYALDQVIRLALNLIGYGIVALWMFAESEL